MLEFELRYLRVGGHLVLQWRPYPIAPWQDVPIVEQYTADEMDVEVEDA